MFGTPDRPVYATPVTYDRPVEGFKSTYFEIESDGGDSEFLQSLGRLLPEKRSRDEHADYFHKEVPMPTFKAMLVKVLLEPNCQPLWEQYWEMAVIADNYSFFKKAVRLAATFVCILASKDGLYDYCHEESSKSQLNNLWESYVAKEGKKGTPIDEVWKNIIVHLKNDRTNQYSLVTESDISAMILEYDYERRANNGFDKPYCYPFKFHFRTIKEGSYSDNFYDEVSKMDYFPTLKPDDYTRLLVILSRGHLADIIDILLSGLDSVDYDTIPTLDNLNRKHKEPLRNLHLIFCILAKRFQREIWTQMDILIRPWVILFHPVLSIIPAVCEVFEVAELRRRALGRRFFTRDLFVWSFYKLGYALPLVVRDTVKLNTAAEDHPLSQICTAVIKLAVSLGVKTIELQHVIFVVLYPNEIDVDVKEPIGSDVAAHFNDFMQVVVADTNDRPQRSTITSIRQDDFEHIFKGGRSYFKVTGLDGTDNKLKVFVA